MSLAPAISGVELDTVSYDISAKAYDGTASTRNEFRTMLQTLLVDRFQLRAHHEKRQVPVYALVVGKSGMKFRVSAPDDASVPDAKFDGHDLRLSFRAIAVGDLAERIKSAGALDRPVVDRAVLRGTYEVTLAFTPENRMNHDGRSIGDTSIFDALQEQLGLRLQPDSALIDILVVNRIGKPSEN